MKVSGGQQRDSVIHIHIYVSILPWGAPRWCSGKVSACWWGRCRRLTFKPWLGKTLWVGNGNPFQYSCLENSVDRGAWQAQVVVHGATKSWTRLSDWAHIVPKLLASRLPHNIKQSSLCYTVRPCWLSIFKCSSVHMSIEKSLFWSPHLQPHFFSPLYSKTP